MSDVAFAELTKTVTALSVDERLALIDIIEQSMNEKSNYDPRIDAINGIFGILTHEEAQDIRNHRVHFGE